MRGGLGGRVEGCRDVRWWEERWRWCWESGWKLKAQMDEVVGEWKVEWKVGSKGGLGCCWSWRRKRKNR